MAGRKECGDIVAKAGVEEMAGRKTPLLPAGSGFGIFDTPSYFVGVPRSTTTTDSINTILTRSLHRFPQSCECIRK